MLYRELDDALGLTEVAEEILEDPRTGKNTQHKIIPLRLQLFSLAYNLGNLLRSLALPHKVKHWSLTTLREKLIKFGAKVVHHSRYVTFQLAEVAVPRELFAAILKRITRVRLLPGTGSCKWICER